MTRAAILATGLPIALATNGTVRLARGLTSRMNTSPSLIAIWTFIRPRTLKRARQRLGLPLDLAHDGGRQRIGRQRAGAVAGMDARLLDMLHHPGDPHRVPSARTSMSTSTASCR